MRNSIKYGLLIGLLTIAALGNAQSVSNSAYNVFGLGSLEQTGLISYEGMGYAAIGARPRDLVNIKNPAALNSISEPGFTQIFDVGITFAHLYQQSGDATASGTFGGLHDLNYWFRTHRKWAWTVGLSRFSDASYDILDSPSGIADRESEVSHKGNGGSTQVYFAGAYQLLPRLSLGVKTGFLFGGLQSEESLFISQPGTSLIIENDRSFLTSFVETGLQYEHSLGESSKLVFGGTFRPGNSVRLKQEEVIIGDTGLTNDSLFAEGGSSLFIPQKFGVGLGLQLKSWDFNLDYEYENWGKNLEQDRFKYRDRFITSFGAQFVKDRRSEKLIERTAFRIGGGLHSNYVSVDGEDYLSQYYTVGLGIPARRGSAAVNVSYQYYRSGTSDFGLIRESTNTISVNITFKDIWFRKKVFY